jgi:hypothetical protein
VNNAKVYKLKTNNKNMVSKKEKARMMDFMVASLEGSGQKITPIQAHNFRGHSGLVNCIGVENKGIIILIDQAFPGNSWLNILCASQRQFGENVGFVFYKDGKTFFRSAAEKNYFKKSKGLSLKNYSTEEMQKMILLRPEEGEINGSREWIQYFQPESTRLDEGLVSFKFGPVVFDYDHIDKGEFKPSDRESTKLFICKEKVEHIQELEFNGRYVLNRQKPLTLETLSADDEAIYRRMLGLKGIRDPAMRVYEAEGIAIQIENYPDDHPLVQAYTTLVAPHTSR